MDPKTREQRRLSFGVAAELYDRARPSYPPEAVRWALGAAPRRVVDLGAGTGLLSRLLASLGHEVVAVEPDDAMRAALTANSAGITALAGAAEAIPLLDASVGAVVAGQAYHWFANDAAHEEIARVLEQGGVFAPLWNDRDVSVGWVAELSRVADLDDGPRLRPRRVVRSLRHRLGRKPGPSFGRWFAAPERATFEHSVAYTAATLLAVIQSRSRYIVASEAERRRIDAGVLALVRDFPEPFVLPYVTVAYRAAKL
jgi:SAM-dependent methyltransferase